MHPMINIIKPPLYNSKTILYYVLIQTEETNIMKMLVQFLVDGELGRTTWIVKSKGDLAFGTIYSQQKDAAVLNANEVEYLKANAGTKYIIKAIMPV